ncbi:MAG: pitrilysin family protein [Acidobacteriota bacterium]
MGVRKKSLKPTAILLISFLLLTVGAGSFSPTLAQTDNLTLPIIKKDSLLNGLQLITLEKPGSGEVSIKVRIKSGAVFDLVGKGGLADLTAGMLLRGGGGYSFKTVEEVVEQSAIRINIKTGWDYTSLEFSGPKDATETIFDLMSRLIISPAFDQKEFDSLKAERLAAIKSATNDRLLIDLKAVESLYGTHPYGKLPQGTSDSLAKITKADLSYFHSKFYLANNAVLIAAGDLSAEEVTKLTRTKLGAWKKGDLVAPSFRAPDSLTGRRVFLIDRPEATVAQMVIAQSGFSRRSTDFLAAVLMMELYKEQIAKLCQQNCSVEYSQRLLNGPILINIQSSPTELTTRVEQLTKLITTMQSSQPEAESVERVKTELIQMMNEKLKNNPAEILFDIDSYGLGKDYLVTFIERVKAITPSDIQKAAKAYLTGSNNLIVVAAPVKAYEMEWKKLGEFTVMP